MDTLKIYLLETAELLANAGYNAKVIPNYDERDDFIKVVIRYHEDKHCTRTWHIRIQGHPVVAEEEIQFCDDSNGRMHTWLLSDPDCFNYLLATMKDLKEMVDHLGQYYPTAKALGVIPDYPE